MCSLTWQCQDVASLVIVAVGCMHATDLFGECSCCWVSLAMSYILTAQQETHILSIKTPHSVQCTENIVHHTSLCCRRVSHYLLENGGDGQMTQLLRLGSGACAGIIGMTATYPLDMVRGRLTVQAGKEYTGILHATRMIVKQVPSVRHTYNMRMSP